MSCCCLWLYKNMGILNKWHFAYTTCCGCFPVSSFSVISLHMFTSHDNRYSGLVWPSAQLALISQIFAALKGLTVQWLHSSWLVLLYKQRINRVWQFHQEAWIRSSRLGLNIAAQHVAVNNAEACCSMETVSQLSTGWLSCTRVRKCHQSMVTGQTLVNDNDERSFSHEKQQEQCLLLIYMVIWMTTLTAPCFYSSAFNQVEKHYLTTCLVLPVIATSPL